MIMVGDTHDDIKNLSRVTREAMFKAIGICGPGVPFADIGDTIEKYASHHGYFVNKDFTGHGIGRNLH